VGDWAAHCLKERTLDGCWQFFQIIPKRPRPRSSTQRNGSSQAPDHFSPTPMPIKTKALIITRKKKKNSNENQLLIAKPRLTSGGSTSYSIIFGHYSIVFGHLCFSKSL